MKQFFFTIDCDWIPGSEYGLKRILDVAKDFKLKSTLFVVGRFALDCPEAIKEAEENYDCEIGSHGWEHGLRTDEDYKSADYEQQKKWIIQSIEAIKKTTGSRPLSFRAPNLWISETLLSVLEETGFLFDSSVPARRFDFWRGQVNQIRYFRSSLNPYHPSPLHFGRKGKSPVLEVPPSAYLIPLNMSALRRLGFWSLRQAVKRLEKRSSILVFYCHPSEFVNPNQLSLPPGESSRFRRNTGPENFLLLEKFISFVMNRKYIPSFISEANIFEDKK